LSSQGASHTSVLVATFVLLSDRKEGIIARTLSPSLDYMDFQQPRNLVTFQEIMEEGFSFNLSSSADVMVFLHIQKTGGTTFGKHLVQDIDLARPCLCHRRRNRINRRKLHCDCFRPADKGDKEQNWLFSRYSTGWKCGLHPDWTELTNCVDSYMAVREGQRDRRYFYITFLREPLARYLSEFKHVARGATWRDSLLRCNGQNWADILPKCYEDTASEPGDWEGVELEEFMACKHNLAVNRQTRMLADLALVGCYNGSGSGMEPLKRERVMLASAKANLEKMAYFGLLEQQKVSQYLFEETFSLEFKVQFEQLNRSETHSGPVREKLSPDLESKILSLNHLDVDLYKFASSLLMHRFNSMKESDGEYSEHWQRLNKENYQFQWEDIEDEDYENQHIS